MADYTLRIPEFQGTDYVAKIEGLCNDLQTDINGAIIPVTSNITITAPLNLDELAADVAINSAKQGNATHTGDVAGATELTIQPLAVETGMINNDAVTFSKIQNIPGWNVIGRNLATTGDVTDITPDQLVTILNDQTTTRVLASDSDQLGGINAANYLRSNVNDTFTGPTLTVQNSLFVKEVEETAVQVTTGASMDLNPANGTYFYLSAAFSGGTARTFTFNTPAASGRVTTMTLELNNGANASSITWPAGVDWPDATEPTWSAGIDIVTFITRDNGTTWLGFPGGFNFGP